MLHAAGVDPCDVPHTYTDDPEEVAEAAEQLIRDKLLRWAHPVMWSPWLDLMHTCTEAMLVDFLTQAGPTPMVCLSVLTWVKPLKGSVSLKRGRVCLQYDDHQPSAPDQYPKKESKPRPVGSAARVFWHRCHLPTACVP